MIVQRLTMRAKPGHFDELLELMKAERDKVEPGRVRILIPGQGRFDTLIYEITHKDQAESDRVWEEWRALPDTPKFFEKWDQLRDGTGGTERFDVVE